jgi:hypothetical protein
MQYHVFGSASLRLKPKSVLKVRYFQPSSTLLPAVCLEPILDAIDFDDRAICPYFSKTGWL